MVLKYRKEPHIVYVFYVIGCVYLKKNISDLWPFFSILNIYTLDIKIQSPGIYLTHIPRSKNTLKYITSTKNKFNQNVNIKATFYLNKGHIESLRSE